MKAQILNKIKTETERELQLVELSENAYHKVAQEEVKTHFVKPKYILFVQQDINQFTTAAFSDTELVGLINSVDVKYVYETELRIFYKVV